MASAQTSNKSGGGLSSVHEVDCDDDSSAFQQQQSPGVSPGRPSVKRPSYTGPPPPTSLFQAHQTTLRNSFKGTTNKTSSSSSAALLAMSISAEVETAQKLENELQDIWTADENFSGRRTDYGLVFQKVLVFFGGGWREYFSYTLIAFLIHLLFGWPYAFPDGLDEETGAACVPYGNNMKSRINQKMCELFLVLERGHVELRVLVAFLVGGFVVNTLHMWRLRRNNYTALCGAVRNLIVQIATLVPFEPTGGQVTMERWALLGYELAVLKGRGLIDMEQGRQHVESLGLLVEGEWQAMVPGDRHTTVWFWVQKRAVLLHQAGVIQSPVQLATICGAVSRIRDKANDLMSLIDRNQPGPYTTVLAALINVNLITLALSTGFEWAIWLFESSGEVWLSPKMWASLLLNMVFNAMFAILYDLSNTLFNPFGPRIDLDVPHSLVGSGLRRLGKELGHARADPPSMTMNVMPTVPAVPTGPVNADCLEEVFAYEAAQVRNARASVMRPPQFMASSITSSVAAPSDRAGIHDFRQSAALRRKASSRFFIGI